MTFLAQKVKELTLLAQRKLHQQRNRFCSRKERYINKGSDFGRVSVTQAIHDAEAVLELAKKKAEAAKEKLEQVCVKTFFISLINW